MTFDTDDSRITAYTFDELEPKDKREFEARLEQSPELRQIVSRTRATVEALQADFDNSERLRLGDKHRAVVMSALDSSSADKPASSARLPKIANLTAPSRRHTRLRVLALCSVAATLLIAALLLLRTEPKNLEMVTRNRNEGSSLATRAAESSLAEMPGQAIHPVDVRTDVPPAATMPAEDAHPFGVSEDDPFANGLVPFADEPPLVYPDPEMWQELTQRRAKYKKITAPDSDELAVGGQQAPHADFETLVDTITTTVESETWEEVGGSAKLEGFPGNLSLAISQSQEVESNLALGATPAETLKTQLIQGLDSIIAGGNEADMEYVVELLDRQQGAVEFETLERLRVTLAEGRPLRLDLTDGRHLKELREIAEQLRDTPDHGRGPGAGGDKYDVIVENEFLRVTDAPLSTFSVDVDTASYSKVRMFLNEHDQLPRPDAVRIEELVNYFPYNYKPPTDEGDKPFAAHQAVASCPWSPDHRLVRIAIKGKEIKQEERPPSNLVFLLDVSGSMDEPNKLPLLKRGMRMLADQLSENDRVAIVVYAGAAGMVLDSTTGDHKAVIVEALDRLQAGGSTNGGDGIQLAYQLALDHFITAGTNRVILCTDGDFNVGTTGTDELVRIVERHAKSGVFLSVLGFGMGNHNDSMLEQISNKGNGNYGFIDTAMEARKVLVEQMSATLVTIAKDVKIQVEFNPAKVKAYRLIGYENRVMADQDFNDDSKDAGEIGAGHTVTALYEIVPAGKTVEVAPAVDELKYQTRSRPTEAASSGELLTLKLRYKQPAGDTSSLLTFPLKDSEQTFNQTDRDFQFAAAVASFGMLLRDSKYKGNATYASVLEIATAAAQNDESGFREEFLHLVRKAAELAGGSVVKTDE